MTGAGSGSDGLGGLRFLGPGDPDHLDQASAYHLRSGQLLRVLTRQLFAYRASGQLPNPTDAFIPKPDVAVRLPTEANSERMSNSRVYTIHLRSGVYWDAKPPREVTALDFVRGMKGIIHPDHQESRPYFTSTILGMQEFCAAYDREFNGKQPSAAELAGFKYSHEIAGLCPAGDRELVITLKQPANDLVNILATTCASAVPVEHDAFLPDSPELALNFVSNGPYRIAQYSADAKEFLLERNPIWRSASDPIRLQGPDRIWIRAAGIRSGSAPREIEPGNADQAWPYGVVSWAKVKAEDVRFPDAYPGYSLNPYLVFNLRSPNQARAMQNLKVRQAIACAVDKYAIKRIFNRLEGVASAVQHSAIPPGNIGHRQFDLDPTPSGRGNSALARELLAQAGYANRLSLIGAVRQNRLHLEVMESIAKDLEKCGICIALRTYKQREYYGSLLSDPANAVAGVWDIAEPGWTPDWFGNNGRTIVRPLFESDSAANYGCYSNAAVDQLIEQALQEPDLARAEDLWHAIDVQVMKDLPILPILAFACQSCVGRMAGAGCGTRSPAPFR